MTFVLLCPLKLATKRSTLNISQKGLFFFAQLAMLATELIIGQVAGEELGSDNKGCYLQQRGNFMNITLPGHIQITVSPSFLIIIGIIIVAIIFFQIIGIKRRRRHTSARRTSTPSRQNGKGRIRSAFNKIDRRVDHGAHIARQHGHERSPEWPRVAHEHLAVEPACVVCGHRGHGLQVHHVKPFHLHPNLELDPNNLITLCELRGRDHHLLVGHLDEWESYNVQVRADCKRYHKMSAAQIRAHPHWQKQILERP